MTGIEITILMILSFAMGLLVGRTSARRAPSLEEMRAILVDHEVERRRREDAERDVCEALRPRPVASPRRGA